MGSPAGVFAQAERMLLITLQYPEQDSFGGPPFSVPDAEVHARFGKTHEIQCLYQQAIPEDDPLVERGMQAGMESVFLLVRRPGAEGNQD